MASLWELPASTNDNLVGVVGMPLLADVIEPSYVHAIVCALRPARRRAGGSTCSNRFVPPDPVAGSNGGVRWRAPPVADRAARALCRLVIATQLCWVVRPRVSRSRTSPPLSREPQGRDTMHEEGRLATA